MIKKIILAALWLPLMALAQSYPSPTFTMITELGSSGSFYAGQGGNVNRIRDRLFVSDAAKNNGTQVGSQPDWLTTFQLANGRTGGFIQLSSMAVLNGPNSQNVNTFVTGSQTANVTIPGVNAIGIVSVGVANNSTTSSSAYAGYNEAYRMPGALGGAYGYEIDTVNYAADTVTDPYQQAGNEVVGLQLAEGAGLSSAGQFPGQAALNIQNNGSTFDIGINFGSSAISGATGSSGTGTAIALGIGHTIQWYGAAGVKTSGIFSTGTTAAGGIRQQFSENQVQWLNGSGNPVFGLSGVSSSANYAQAQNATTGNAPTISAQGSDTNITLAVSGKGTGAVNVKGGTSGAAAAAGFVGETPTNTTSGTSLTTGTTANCASTTLGAGYWLVWGNIDFVPNASTTVSQIYAGINTTSATLPGASQLTALIASLTTGGQQLIPTPLVPLNLSSSTTVYLTGNANFGVSTMTCTGTITAVRYH